MRRFSGILLLLFVLSGCGQTSFVGKQFDNFTAYYNKFFNARKAFESGVKSLESRDTRIDRNRYLPLFTNPDAGGASTDFQDTIKKSADVLREHPNSKWVDDALLLIGKSYFYQRNYVGAEQKFLEVVALKTALEDEARFWLARTLITGGNYDEAAQFLTESLNRENVSRRWKPMMQLAMGEMYVQREDWINAADALSTGLENVRDKDLGARAQFLLGQVYETIEDYEKAYEAYSRVERFHPLYELTYAAKLSAVRVQGSYLDEEEALRELRRMERDDKNYQYRNELSYVRGRIYQMQGHADDAFLVYDDILYDADGDISMVRGRIHYALAELYRDVYLDYLTAAAHFDTASTAISTGTGGATRPGAAAGAVDLYSPEAITDAVEQKETFASFSDVMFRINEMDSLLYLGSLEPAAFDEAIMRIRRQLAAELEAQQRELERRQASQAFREAGATETARSRTGATAASGASGEAGFLYHRDPMLVQEARLNFETVWGERPLVPNWRRSDAVNSYLAAISDSPDGDSLAAEVMNVGDELPVVDLGSIPRDSLSRVEMRSRRAAASYELANVLFLSMNEPDSAATWYRMVIEDAHDSTLIQRAYYALAEVQQSVGDADAARMLYEVAADLDSSTDLGRQISQRIGRPVPAISEGDTLAAATSAYERAYFKWRQGNFRSALSDMIEVACLYPDTEIAPKALMAAGTIFSEWARRDSLDILGGIPVSVPDSLLSQVGLSRRTTRVVPDMPGAMPPVPVADSLTLSLTGLTDSLGVLASDSLGVEYAIDPPAPADDVLADAAVDSVLTPDSILTPAATDSIALAKSEGELLSDSTTVQVAPEDPALAAVAPGDTLSGLPEADLVLADSAATARADSLRGEQMAAAVDSIIVEQFEPINLDRLYASITTRYSESPFAQRAGSIREALEERRQELAEADSLARIAADSANIAIDPNFIGPIAPDSLLSDSLLTTGASLDSLASTGGIDELVEPAVQDSLGLSPQATPPDSSAIPVEVIEPSAGSEADSTDVDKMRARRFRRAPAGEGAPADSTAEPVY